MAKEKNNQEVTKSKSVNITTQPGESEALSSHVSSRFDLIPRPFLERVAARFELGIKKYPEFNYTRGLADKKYILDRLNHLQEHVQALLWPQTTEEFNDDNEAAIGWAIAFLMLCNKETLHKIRLERFHALRETIAVNSMTDDLTTDAK